MPALPSTLELSLMINSAAEKAAREAVKETLLALGIDTLNPLQAQKDFASLREVSKLMDDEAFVADLAHLRRWRLGLEATKMKTVFLVVSAVVTGTIGFYITGLKEWIANVIH